jgi:hypothetical protein
MDASEDVLTPICLEMPETITLLYSTAKPRQNVAVDDLDHGGLTIVSTLP